MAYWRLYYHFVWGTKDRLPLITPGIEARLHDLIAERCRHEKGRVLAVNGIADHVHVIAAVPPTIPLALFVQRVKGASAFFISQEGDAPFKWQTGYGVFSVGPQGLKRAIDYVKRQKEHHASGQLIKALELFSEDDEGPPEPA